MLKIKLSVASFIIFLALSACSGNVPTATDLAQNTITPLPTLTDTPIPSNAPSLTPTITATATITPTATVTPENFVLADSGYDIADVKISYPREDILHLEFKYRLAEGYKTLPDEFATITLVLPPQCMLAYNWYPSFNPGEPAGQGYIDYKMLAEGECNMSSFEMVITIIKLYGCCNPVSTEVYRERIRQPFTVVRNYPAISPQVLTVKNFSFRSTGNWAGQLTFDYAFSPSIPLEREKYRFTLYGVGEIYLCEFNARGPVITKAEGTYTIAINFSSKTEQSINPNCLDKYSILTFDNLVLLLDDLLPNYRADAYRHAIDLVITLKKQP